MGKNGAKAGLEIDLQGLKLLWNFGWLRPQELGRLIWKENANSRKYGERLGRKWKGKKFVIDRKLPNGSGTAYLLSQGGVNFLHGFGVKAISGKDWGIISEGVWQPPKWWRHDLLTTSLLAGFHAEGHEVITELQLRRENRAKKIPDGIIIHKENGIAWLEVESARKSGPAIESMADALILISQGECPCLSNQKATTGLVAYEPFTTDERGHLIDHKARVIHAIQRKSVTDVNIVLVSMEIENFAVSKWDSEELKIESDIISKRLSLWKDNFKWDKRDNGISFCNIGGVHASYWRSENKTWQWKVVDTRDPRPHHLRHDNTWRAEIVASGNADSAAMARRTMAGLSNWDIDGHFSKSATAPPEPLESF